MAGDEYLRKIQWTFTCDAYSGKQRLRVQATPSRPLTAASGAALSCRLRKCQRRRTSTYARHPHVEVGKAIPCRSVRAGTGPEIIFSGFGILLNSEPK